MDIDQKAREAAAKAVYENRGLHLSTGKEWQQATEADRYYCASYAEAAIIAYLSALQAAEPREKWYLGLMNGGLFIMNKPPRPSNDSGPMENTNEPTLALPIHGLPINHAVSIVTAHNASLAYPAPASGRDNAALIADQVAELEPLLQQLTARAEAAEVALHAAEPDFVYDPNNWDCTYAWQDRAYVHADAIPLGGAMRVATLFSGPDKWVACVPTWTDDGDPDETRIEWFDSEEEAIARLAQRPATPAQDVKP